MRAQRPSPADEARRTLDAAAAALSRFTAGLGLPAPEAVTLASERPAEAARLEFERRRAEEALAKVRALTEQLAAEKLRANEASRNAALEAHARDRAIEATRSLTAALEESGKRERQARLELADARTQAHARPSEEAAAAPDERAAQLQARLSSAEGRLALMRAEIVRVETLRAKADDAVAAAEASKRAIESALRHDLRAANAALDRAAAEGGALEGKGRLEINALREQLAQAERRAEQRERAFLTQIAELEAQLAATSAVAAPDLAPAADESAPATLKELPAVEAVLDPGWSRLMRTARPPVENAYAHLRRLSAGPLSGGQRALLRLTAASLSAAVEALSTADLVLSEAPAPASAAAGALIDGLLTTWEAAFRSKGLILKRDFSREIPDAPHESEALRLVLHHILRNAFEALPRDAALTVKAHPSPDGALCLEFIDDGPGFPAAWLARRFEPFSSPRRGHAGLGLCAARRTMRRWGGDVTAAAAVGGHGAHLTLLFAAPAAAGPELKAL
jgi:signal transduction histidine kinase